jgi:hypothetical protein
MAFFLLILMLSGCAFLNQPNNTVIEDPENQIQKTIPQVFQLHDVPHNPRKQQGTDCAPDSLRMVLTYRGKQVNEQDIVRHLDSRGAGGGTSFRQMQEIASKVYNLPSFLIHNCDIDTIKSAILNKWAPIIGYRSGGRYYHAVVAVGYDEKRRMMFVHDPNILGVRKIRYSDLGGFSEDGVQRLSVLIVLPENATPEELAKGLSKYSPKDKIDMLLVSGMLPSQEKSDQIAK